jgi:uncharacterized protein YkwD
MKLKNFATIFLAAFILSNCSATKPKLKNHKIINTNNINSSFSNYAINYINKIRSQNSSCANATTPLNYNNALEAAAMAHAKDMALNKYLEHHGSGNLSDVAKKENNSKFYERILFFGYPAKTYDLVGEGITYTKYKTYKTKNINKLFKYAMDSLMKDYEHCKIIMNPRFQDVGVGYYQAKDRVYWVLDFGETK